MLIPQACEGPRRPWRLFATQNHFDTWIHRTASLLPLPCLRRSTRRQCGSLRSYWWWSNQVWTSERSVQLSQSGQGAITWQPLNLTYWLLTCTSSEMMFHACFFVGGCKYSLQEDAKGRAHMTHVFVNYSHLSGHNMESRELLSDTSSVFSMTKTNSPAHGFCWLGKMNSSAAWKKLWRLWNCLLNVHHCVFWYIKLWNHFGAITAFKEIWYATKGMFTNPSLDKSHGAVNEPSISIFAVDNGECPIILKHAEPRKSRRNVCPL